MGNIGEFFATVGNADPAASRAIAIGVMGLLLVFSLYSSFGVRRFLTDLQVNFLDAPRGPGRPATRPKTIRRQLAKAEEFEASARSYVMLSAIHFLLVAFAVPTAVLLFLVSGYQWLQFGDIALISTGITGCEAPSAISAPSSSELLAFLLNQFPEQFRASTLPWLSSFLPAHFKGISHNPDSNTVSIAVLAFRLWLGGFVLEGLGNFAPKLLRAYFWRSSRVEELKAALDEAEEKAEAKKGGGTVLGSAVPEDDALRSASDSSPVVDAHLAVA